jgi:molecular chaperone DnaK (HSP70)
MMMPSTENQESQHCLGIDFGMSNTVIARYDRNNKSIILKEFPGWSRNFPLEGQNNKVPVIPSLIHYDNGSILIGEQVFSQNCGDDPATAQWMKQYILQNSPAQFPLGRGQMTGFCQAATDFLKILLSRVSGTDQKDLLSTADCVFTFPVDAPHEYISWLEETALSSGFRKYHLIDEAYAAALGYGLNPHSGSRILMIEFGQDGLDIKIIAFAEENPHLTQVCSRVLGRAGSNFGGSAIDACILRDIFKREGFCENEVRMKKANSEMLRSISRMKEKISRSSELSVPVTDRVCGREIRIHFGCSDLDRIFDEQGMSDMLNRTLDRALATARMRGCEENQIDAVLMIGECSNLPQLKEAVIQRFCTKPVLYHHPVDAVARGAAMYIPLTPSPNRIRNNYALRYWDPAAHEHRFRFLVRTGARYPSPGQVARIIVSASYDSQTRLGIPIFEINRNDSDLKHCNLELISDYGGGIRVAGSAMDGDVAGKSVWVNEGIPMILVASPPARKSEPRFELTFTIDMKRNLCVTVKDIITGLLIKKDTPLVRMT